MRDGIVRDVRIRDRDVVWRMGAGLRVAIEAHEGGEVLAYLMADPTFAGHGSCEHDAIADMLDEVAHELRFYRNADASELTSDAKAAKAWLAKRFEAVTQGD